MSYPIVTDDFDFRNWRLVKHFTDHVYKSGTIEAPANWTFEYIPGMETSERPDTPDSIDYNRIPQSLHRDNGMVIAAGYRKWQAGYRHSSYLTVKRGQRYLASAVFQADIGGTLNPHAIEWMWFVDGKMSAQSDWSSYGDAARFNTPEEHLFVFEAAADGVIQLTFWARSQWRDNTCDLLVKDLRVLEVESSYGGADYGAVVPFGEATTPDPVPVPVPAPTLTAWLLPAGIALAVLFAVLLLFRPQATASQAVIMPIAAPISLEEAGTLIISVAVMFLYSRAQSPIVQAFVQFLKAGLPFVKVTVPTEYLLLGVSGGVTILGFIATRQGFDGQLNTAYDLLILVLPPLTNFIGVFTGSQGLYDIFKAMRLPLFGYKRS